MKEYFVYPCFFFVVLFCLHGVGSLSCAELGSGKMGEPRTIVTRGYFLLLCGSGSVFALRTRRVRPFAEILKTHDRSFPRPLASREEAQAKVPLDGRRATVILFGSNGGTSVCHFVGLVLESRYM